MHLNLYASFPIPLPRNGHFISAVSDIKARACNLLVLLNDVLLLKPKLNCKSFDEFSFLLFEKSQAALILYEQCAGEKTILNDAIFAIDITLIL